MDPSDPFAYSVRRLLGWAYEYNGNHDEAKEEFLDALKVQGAKEDKLEALRKAYKSGGMKAYWQKWLDVNHDTIKQGRLGPLYLAQIHSFLGENDLAFQNLEKALEDRSIFLPQLRFGPNFDGLRNDRRYSALLKKLGVEK
jgi:tetratricopeptide (TPR) repeat protein